MTEAEWLLATDPQSMLEFLRARGGASGRKLRLFAVGCCRKAWGRPGPKAKAAAEVAEAHADGKAGRPALAAARRDVRRGTAPAGVLAYWTTEPVPLTAAASTVSRGEGTGALADSFMAALLRDVFGNPFRPPPPLAPAVLSWDGGTVARLAAAIYDERAFDRLPVLADALEDAGCADAAILGHCRGGGEHVRGCWVVDLVLGKG
jgi:hypothetical protein